MTSFAIIGFGFCGRLSLFHLAKKLQAGDKITIFEKNSKDTLGTAFSNFSQHYILNIPASKMSAFSDRPDDFSNFLAKKYPQIWQEIGANGFAPRHIYGEYLAEITAEALAKIKQKNIELEFVNDEVIAIEKPQEFLVKTKKGETHKASQILLATSFKQSKLPFNFESENFIKNLWDPKFINFHHRNFSNQTICLIGCGLTAVDVIVGLKNKNFTGKIIAISRRGNFPKKHLTQDQKNPDFITADDAKKGLLFLILKIRKFLRANPQFDLRHVIASIRPITQKLWQDFDDKNKKLFLRFWPYWNIFRHRAPISSIVTIEEMIDLGQISLRKNGVKNISQKGEKFLIESGKEILECDVVVNCLGFDLKAQNYPLFDQMMRKGLLKKDLLLASSADSNLHLLGGLNIGRDFESTSVPDLRANVESVIKS